jgi:integral membrane protein
VIVQRSPAPIVGVLRTASLVEAASYLVLLAAILAHSLGGPDATWSVGLTHGVIYLLYAALVLAARRSIGWNTQQTAQALIVAAVPLGALTVHRELASHEPVHAPLRQTAEGPESRRPDG